MSSQHDSGKRRQEYLRPQLVKHENLKKVTAVWQCSAVDCAHEHQRGQGHRSHGQGFGYGHFKAH